MPDPARGAGSLSAITWRGSTSRQRCGLAALSDDERVCIALRYGAGLTVREIATALGEPETTVDGRVYRALRKLRDQIL